MAEINFYRDIYDKIFSYINKSNIDIFLCGAASSKEKISCRDQIRSKLELNNYLSILYPEDMFMELLDRKKYDLLTLEKFLAKNSDLIIIVCESPGSFTELGAFVNNSDTFSKVVVLLQTKYKNAKSFISQGPVEYVKKRNRNNVIYFNNDISKATDDINNYIKRNFGYDGSKRKELAFKDLNLISGQYYYIVLLLFFFKYLPVRELVDNIKEIYLDEKYDKTEFDVIYSAAIKRLFKDGLIKKEVSNSNNKYSLTDKGYNYAAMLLDYVNIKNRTKIINSIRIRILSSLYY